MLVYDRPLVHLDDRFGSRRAIAQSTVRPLHTAPLVRPRRCATEVIARLQRFYEREDQIFDPLHYLPLIER